MSGGREEGAWTLSTDDDDGNKAVGKHLDRFAPEHNRGNAAPPVLGHDNGVAS